MKNVKNGLYRIAKSAVRYDDMYATALHVEDLPKGDNVFVTAIGGNDYIVRVRKYCDGYVMVSVWRDIESSYDDNGWDYVRRAGYCHGVFGPDAIITPNVVYNFGEICHAKTVLESYYPLLGKYVPCGR